MRACGDVVGASKMELNRDLQLVGEGISQIVNQNEPDGL